LALPRQCNRGTKCNAQGYKTSWNGYKLHIDTSDSGVPVSALLSSASMHDCLAAVPLSLISAQRGANKVMSHLMLGILALTADQLMRLRC